MSNKLVEIGKRDLYSEVGAKSLYYKSFTFDVGIGSVINGAIDEAKDYAKKLNCEIKFEFNGRLMHVYPDTCSECLGALFFNAFNNEGSK